MWWPRTQSCSSSKSLQGMGSLLTCSISHLPRPPLSSSLFMMFWGTLVKTNTYKTSCVQRPRNSRSSLSRPPRPAAARRRPSLERCPLLHRAGGRPDRQRAAVRRSDGCGRPCRRTARPRRAGAELLRAKRNLLPQAGHLRRLLLLGLGVHAALHDREHRRQPTGALVKSGRIAGSRSPQGGSRAAAACSSSISASAKESSCTPQTCRRRG